MTLPSAQSNDPSQATLQAAAPLIYRPLVIGIVAGEVSGDALGADLMRQLNNLRDDIVWVGVGGSQMQAEGLTSVIDMSRLAVMGLVEVVKHLPDLFKAKDEILTAFNEAKIDMFIGIDAPDFNLRLGKTLKSQGIFCVQYVSPSIWAWRENRIEKIKQATDLVLCLFPFELPVYQKHAHPAVCVGHPLLHTLEPTLTNTPMDERRRELIWANDMLRQFFGKAYQGEMTNMIAVMPGSRTGEIKSILPKMLDAIRKLLVVDSTLCFVIPTVNQNHKTIVEGYLENEASGMRQHVVVCCDESQTDFSQQIMASADLVLLASGTATLEAMLLGRPMVVIYVMKNLTYQIAKRLVKVPYVALPNILVGREIVPELIQHEATAENISRVVQQTLKSAKYQQQLTDLQQTTTQLRQQSSYNPALAVIDGWLASLEQA